jgi:hypothetical protein
MAAASANRDDKRQDGKLKAHLVAASTTIYKGTLTCHNATGYLKPGADTASFKFAGVAYEKCDNSDGADGDLECRVEKYGEYEFAYNGGDATQALLGQEVYIVDDQTVDEDAAVTTNDIKCGVITEVISVSKVRVRIDNYAR